MVKRVLMIAYHYPPLRGSSGILRTLKFSRYLPEFGWDPIVLTAHPRAYLHTSMDQMDDISDRVSVHRAFAFDTSKHLSFNGRYPGFLALPDRWISWWLGAVPTGLRLIRHYRPDVIWSTYPIATAHVIGYTLHRLTGIPWVADFRDPMTDEAYPPDPRTRRAYRWIERKTMRHCAQAVFTTPGTQQDYATRFSHLPASRFGLIENGYDEENFSTAPVSAPHAHPKKPVVLVHSGIIYPSERDPVHFFQALALLSQQGAISADTLKVVLRATAHDGYLKPLIAQYGIGHLVFLAPPIPYREALSEMLDADGLLILQASNCNHQIPAKLYEYLRAQRPILALTDPQGNTAAALRQAGIDTIAALDSTEDIVRALPNFLELIERDAAPMASMDRVLTHSRRAKTGELSQLLDQVTQRSPS